MLTRRRFLKATGGITALLAAGWAGNIWAQEEQEQKLNILWLISEDTSADMACYGNKQVKTPNFDRLASNGILFNNAFASCPVCSAVRSGLNTGMYQTSIGAHNHRSHRKDGYKLPDGVRIVTDYFREAGYYTSNCAGLNFDKPGKTDWNFNVEGKPFDGKDWRGRKEGQPFFAQVNLQMTHRTFKRDKKNPIDPAKVELPPYYPDHPLSRRDWADYLESIQVLDGQIGEVLKRLEEDGLAENTIVFYFGDHGRCHVRGKQWLYEGGIRIPMIVRFPGRIARGSVMEDMISTIDIAPTSLAMARIDVPKHMQGRVFGGPDWKKRDYIVSARDRCDETVDRIRCVRTKQYKYIRNYYPDRPYTQMNCYKKQAYPMLTVLEVWKEEGKLTDAQKQFMGETRPAEELYDLVKDPHEVNNLAGKAEHAEVMKDLSAKLDKWIVETGDKGEKPEDEKETKYWSDFFSKRYAKLMKGRGLGEDPSAKARLAWWEKKMLGKSSI